MLELQSQLSASKDPRYGTNSWVLHWYVSLLHAMVNTSSNPELCAAMFNPTWTTAGEARFIGIVCFFWRRFGNGSPPSHSSLHVSRSCTTHELYSTFMPPWSQRGCFSHRAELGPASDVCLLGHLWFGRPLCQSSPTGQMTFMRSEETLVRASCLACLYIALGA